VAFDVVQLLGPTPEGDVTTPGKGPEYVLIVGLIVPGVKVTVVHPADVGPVLKAVDIKI
jgi:hypothetical protein